MTHVRRGPERTLAHRCPKLLAYVHVSTAYVNCNRPSGSRVQEELPKCSADAEALLLELEGLKDASGLHARTQELLAKDGYPNTYTFTKAMGEKLLFKYHGDVPGVCMTSTEHDKAVTSDSWLRRPRDRWVDTVSAGGAMYLSGGLGLMQVCPGDPNLVGDQIPVDLVCPGDPNLVGDQIPVDLVANTILAAACIAAVKGTL
ncbi:hypothetical protein T484DRAFT_1804101 [Baffinella frigidus]|nr:hypothetical protein T484DRAFT_1804101 [Cryptophyta sp. CCMP2293]